VVEEFVIPPDGVESAHAKRPSIDPLQVIPVREDVEKPAYPVFDARSNLTLGQGIPPTKLCCASKNRFRRYSADFFVRHLANSDRPSDTTGPSQRRRVSSCYNSIEIRLGASAGATVIAISGGPSCSFLRAGVSALPKDCASGVIVIADRSYRMPPPNDA
jgi:hypothetical protein